jgi:hypothetical protein
MKLAALLALFPLSALAAPVPLFDGKSFTGWSGDTQFLWRVVDGCIVGGSLTQKIPHNEFLATKRPFANFDLTLKFKLLGTEGFVNSGVQFRSVHIKDPAYEMRGYQADIGPKYWGSLHDESRRNKVLAAPDQARLKAVVKEQDWNTCRVRCEGSHIQLWLNGVQTVDYLEKDEKIAAERGVIALQVHGGGKSEVWFKDLRIEELP